MTLSLENNTPKIYLNMIVKNESKVILRLLQSILPLIDGYCICDTGSTDNTIELIRTFFKMANLPGIVVSEPFRDFGYNRSFALKEALTAPGITEEDYLLLMDADMILTGPILTNPLDFKKALTHDVYLLMQGSDTFYYKNARIVRNKGYSYWGVTHEYLNTAPGTTYYTIEKPLLFIQDIGDGGSKSDKWERDIRLLTKGLEENPNADRYAFYLANTYRDSGNHLKAIEYYKIRIQKGGWIEEVWQSYFSAGKCYMAISDFPNALNMWLEGYQVYPNRIENLYFIINYYRNIGKNRNSYQFYRIAKDSMKRFGGASDEFLFLEKDIYEYKLDYEMTILGYYENPDNIDLKTLSMKVLSNRLVEDGISKNVLSNYKFYSEKAISYSASSINNNLSTILNQVGFTIHTNLSDNSLTGLYPSTPSLTFLNNNILIMNKRYVNYRIDDTGNYINQDHIISKNIVAIIDLSTNSIKTELVLEYDTSLDNTYVGLEDIRLHVGPDGQIYYNTNRGLDVSTIQVEYGMIEIQDDTIIRTINNRIIQSPNNREIEKNWILFNSSQDQLLCVYEFYPLTIGHIQDNHFIPVYQQTNLPPFFKHIRGSTNGVQINGDEIWFIGHIVSYESRRYYYHIVVVLDRNTRQLKRYTNMFTFEGQPVEYTLGFIELSSNLLIGYSVLDRETKFIEVPKDWFEKQMILYI
jgi:tetratricopeptide (TPR) repeat protein